MWTPGSQVFLEYGGIVVRSLTPADIDAAFMAKILDANVNRFLGIPRNLTRARMEEVVAKHDNRTRFILGIYAGGEKTGQGYWQINVNPAQVATVLVMIGDISYWGRGLSTTTSWMVRRFLFEEAGVERIEARVYEDNAKVLAYMAKTNYVHEATLREVEPDGKGGWHDVRVYGMLKSDWPEAAPRKRFSRR